MQENIFINYHILHVSIYTQGCQGDKSQLRNIPIWRMHYIILTIIMCELKHLMSLGYNIILCRVPLLHNFIDTTNSNKQSTKNRYRIA